MLSIVSDYIVDSMDETMQSYYRSEVFVNRQNAINERMIAFRNKLSDDHKSELNELMDMISNADSETTKEAYKIAFAQGLCFREETIVK